MPFCVLASMCQFGFGFEVKWLAVIRLKVTGYWSKVFRLRVIRFYPFYKKGDDGMKSIKMIRELNERLCDITVILSDAKRVKDETGENPLPYDVYKALCDERRKIRDELANI